MPETVHVVLASDDGYAVHLGVAMTSVLLHRGEESVTFHVIDGGICHENREKLRLAAGSFGADLAFVPVESGRLSRLDLRIRKGDHVTQAAYYRLLLPSLLMEPRCIYMDCDMICRSSLKPLWETDLGSRPAAAVRDIDEDRHAARLGLDRYFNSGLLLMDLDRMRQEGLQQDFLRCMREQAERIVMHDQDVLNVVLQGRIRELDMTWNCQVTRTRKCRETGFHALSRTANVLHFIGHRKPWTRGCRAPGRREYHACLQRTPWRQSLAERLLHFFF